MRFIDELGHISRCIRIQRFSGRFATLQTNSASRPVTVTPRSPSRGVHLRIPSTLHASGNSYNFEEGSAVSGEDDAAFITGVPAGPLDDLLGQVNALLNQVHDILN